jgi:hypothetical protein
MVRCAGHAPTMLGYVPLVIILCLRLPGKGIQAVQVFDACAIMPIAMSMFLLYRVYSDVERGVALVIYCARECGGELSAGHETRAVGFFPPDALPELAFAQNHTIIDDWLRRKDH